MKNKVNWPKVWRWFTLAFFAVCWIVLVFYMRLSEWVLVPVYVAYLVVCLVLYRGYVLGTIGNFFLMVGRSDKAFAYYEKAVKRNTTNVFCLYNYAIEILKEGNTTDALAHLTRARKLNANLIMEKNIILAMGSCYWVQDNIDKAIETLEGLKRDYNYINAHVLTTLGYFYYLKEEDAKALEYSEQALDDEPEHAPAWDNIGQIHFRQGDLKKAREAFEKALSYKQTMVDSIFFMGLICEQEGDIASANQYFKRAAACPLSALNTVTKEQIDSKCRNREK